MMSKQRSSITVQQLQLIADMECAQGAFYAVGIDVIKSACQ